MDALSPGVWPECSQQYVGHVLRRSGVGGGCGVWIKSHEDHVLQLGVGPWYAALAGLHQLCDLERETWAF